MTGSSARSRAIDDDRGDATWRALAAPPDRQRAVLVLRLYEGLPDHEIAVLMGTREAIVRSLANLGTARLRAAGG